MHTFLRDMQEAQQAELKTIQRDAGDEINIDIKDPCLDDLAHNEAKLKKQKKESEREMVFVRKDIEFCQATTSMNDKAKINKNKLY